MKKFWTHASKRLKAGLFITAFFFILGFVVYYFPHINPFSFNSYPKKLLPSLEHLLGTTTMGQDTFWLLIEAIHNSLLIGLIVATIGTVLGVLVGLIAGFSGGALDRVLMVITDTFVVIPSLPILILMTSLMKGTSTVIMLALGNFVRNQGWLMLVAIIFIVGCSRLAWASASFRERFDAMWLTLPILGKLSRGYNAARFAGTLSMLAAAGVPILKALQAAADTLSNRAMRTDALDALVLVREGAPLASALAQKKRFPGLLSMFARLGEQTGQLPVMLERAAKQLSTEVQRRAMQLATLLEPLLIVAMGLVVMLIVLAVLLPIIQLNQLVR